MELDPEAMPIYISAMHEQFAAASTDGTHSKHAALPALLCCPLGCQTWHLQISFSALPEGQGFTEKISQHRSLERKHPTGDYQNREQFSAVKGRQHAMLCSGCVLHRAVAISNT